MASLPSTVVLDDDRSRRRAGWLGLAILTVVLVAGLLWAKWLPYTAKVGTLTHDRVWPGSSIFASAGSAPSIAGAWQFTVTYLEAVWKALLVALLVGAAIAGIPGSWLERLTRGRGPLGQAIIAAAASMPCMMCTCCTAPVAVGLRRSGTPLAPTVAYWIGNPMLNPAVLVFLALVLPWQYAAVRIGVGLAVVLGAAVLVGRRREATQAPSGNHTASDTVTVRGLPRHYLRRLLSLALVLVPEYVVVVFAVGLVSSWASDFSALAASAGILAVLLLAVVGTLLVIPTGGEIPVLVALVAAGVGAGPAGALLITLPAVSLPSMVMVARSLSWRATLSVAGVVVIGGLVGAAALALVMT